MGYKQTSKNHALLTPLLALSVLALICGVIVIGVAINLAVQADQFADPRYATYWMGIAAVVVFLLYLFIWWNIRKERGMAMFAFVVFTIVVVAGTVCGIVAMANLAAHAHTMRKVDEGNCLYIDRKGIYSGADTRCQVQCERGMKRTHNKPNPPRTCCCCVNPLRVNGYDIVAAKGVNNCDVMHGVVAHSVTALAVLNALTAVIYLAMTVICLIILCGWCGQQKLFEKEKGDGSPYNPYA